MADTAPTDQRGAALGFFDLVSAIAMLLASVVAGLLWDQLEASVTFHAAWASMDSRVMDAKEVKTAR